MFFRILPVILSGLLISAHFLRDRNIIPMAVVLCLLFVLFIRKNWVRRVWQVILACAALIWIHTGYNLLQMRIAHGQPWTRLLIIMAAVVIFTLFSAVWLENRRFKDYYNG